MIAIKGFYSFTTIYKPGLLLLRFIFLFFFFLLYDGVIALLNWYVFEWNLSELKC